MSALNMLALIMLVCSATVCVGAPVNTAAAQPVLKPFDSNPVAFVGIDYYLGYELTEGSVAPTNKVKVYLMKAVDVESTTSLSGVPEAIYSGESWTPAVLSCEKEGYVVLQPHLRSDDIAVNDMDLPVVNVTCLPAPGNDLGLGTKPLPNVFTVKGGVAGHVGTKVLVSLAKPENFGTLGPLTKDVDVDVEMLGEGTSIQLLGGVDGQGRENLRLAPGGESLLLMAQCVSAGVTTVKSSELVSEDARLAFKSVAPFSVVCLPSGDHGYSAPLSLSQGGGEAGGSSLPGEETSDGDNSGPPALPLESTTATEGDGGEGESKGDVGENKESEAETGGNEESEVQPETNGDENKESEAETGGNEESEIQSAETSSLPPEFESETNGDESKESEAETGGQEGSTEVEASGTEEGDGDKDVETTEAGGEAGESDNEGNDDDDEGEDDSDDDESLEADASTMSKGNKLFIIVVLVGIVAGGVFGYKYYQEKRARTTGARYTRLGQSGGQSGPLPNMSRDFY